MNICYLSLIIYISNKLSDDNDDSELNEIFGNIFSLSLEKLINILLLLYINENIDKNHDLKQFQNYENSKKTEFKPIIKNTKSSILSVLREIYSPKKLLKNDSNLLFSKENINNKKKTYKNLDSGISEFKILLNNYKTNLSLNNIIFSNKHLQIYDSLANISLSTNSNTELSKKFHKEESPIKIKISGNSENINSFGYFNRKIENISPSLLDSKRNNQINIQKEANISLFKINNILKSKMKSCENLTFKFNKDRFEEDNLNVNQNLGNNIMSEKGITINNNNNLDQSLENSLNSSKNSVESENQINCSINSNSLSSIELDSNSCNNFSPLFDDKFSHNKDSKSIKSKFCIQKEIQFKKNESKGDKLSNFKTNENEENSIIHLKENLSIYSYVELDEKEYKKQIKRDENFGGIVDIEQKEEKEEKADLDFIDKESISSSKDISSKITENLPNKTQLKFNEIISKVIGELLLYLKNSGKKISLFNNDCKSNEELKISGKKDSIKTNNNCCFSKKNISSKNYNENNENSNKINNKICNKSDELLIKHKEDKIKFNIIEQTREYKEEEELNVSKNKKEEDIHNSHNDITEDNSPVNKMKQNFLYNSPSKKLKDKRIKINNNINLIKPPVNIVKGNDLQVSRFPNKGLAISSFILILPLATGGYGSVGLYKKISTGDFYAIKSVNISSMKEKNLSRTLKQEKSILKEINSDYIVNSYFIFKDKKNYYYVMEYLPGGDVFKLLSNIILPESTIQLIMAETILGINYLHKIHIIHHDIKPENILITKDGHFKLADFGLSKTIKEDFNYDSYLKNFQNLEFINKNTELSYEEDENETNQAVGTLNYMAPELFTEEYPEGPNIDYWSLGVVLYELYSFKVPFEAETQEQTRKNIIDFKINWDILLNDEMKKQYKNIENGIDLIKKFLVKNPAERWGDNNLKDIQNHPFFEGLNWENIKKIKNQPVMKYLKKVVEETNKKIKEKMKDNINDNCNNSKDNIFPCELDFEQSEKSDENFTFTERLDNLTKRNNELIKMKFKKKEFHCKELKDNESLFLDLK